MLLFLLLLLLLMLLLCSADERGILYADLLGVAAVCQYVFQETDACCCCCTLIKPNGWLTPQSHS
jgi:hypothetical protein